MTISLSGIVEGQITIAGIFIVKDPMIEVDDSHAFEKIAASILFPYARSIFSFISAADGSTPFILPTINLNNVIFDNKV